MSRIGKSPITIPSGVEVKVGEGNLLTVKGPKGTLTKQFEPSMKIKVDNGVLTIERPSEEKEIKALHGLTRALLNNMVTGVTSGYQKTLEINGVGYRAAKQGKKVVLTLGFSHPVEISEVEGITIDVPTPNSIVVKGIDKELVGQIAANIRAKKVTEPYKGKGIKYEGEYVRRKVGKAGAKKK